jgi:ubiquinone/menaquinone biosynthesis C-methylase UbiE
MENDQRHGKARLVRENFARPAANFDNSGYFALSAERLVDLVEISNGEQVLDIGTGTGAVLLAAAKRVGPKGQGSLGFIRAPPVSVENALTEC